MQRSTTSFLFPDLNVWIALTYRRHIHYVAASKWLDSVPAGTPLSFCRITQIGFLRLLTTSAVMSDMVMTQSQAWGVYDSWLGRGDAILLDEPNSIEPLFRSITQSNQMAPKDWADSYLCAFADAAELQLVTFDRILHRRSTNSLLLST